MSEWFNRENAAEGRSVGSSPALDEVVMAVELHPAIVNDVPFQRAES